MFIFLLFGIIILGVGLRVRVGGVPLLAHNVQGVVSQIDQSEDRQECCFLIGQLFAYTIWCSLPLKNKESQPSWLKFQFNFSFYFYLLLLLNIYSPCSDSTYVYNSIQFVNFQSIPFKSFNISSYFIFLLNKYWFNDSRVICVNLEFQGFFIALIFDLFN